MSETEARVSERKHGASCAKAACAFFDDARIISDVEWQRLLVVCHFCREGGFDHPHHISAHRRSEGGGRLRRISDMRDHYDFAKSKKNPYTRILKRQITIRLDRETVDYFKALAAQMNLPYQTLINMYLRDCALQKRKLTLSWSR